MHLSADQFANVRHMIEERFADTLEMTEEPHIRYDEKLKEGVQNGTIYTYTFQQGGKKFKMEVIKKQKMSEHEKMKDGKVVGRFFEEVPGQFMLTMDLFRDEYGEWIKMDLDIDAFLG